MITKFLKKRNVNPNLPFAKNFARIQVHSNGSHSFKFTKRTVQSPVAGDFIQTEAGLYLTNESGAQLTTG
jgi:hypothetical protein